MGHALAYPQLSCFPHPALSLPPAHALSPLPSLLSPCSRQTSTASGKMRGFPIPPLSISNPCARMRGRSAVRSRLASLPPSLPHASPSCALPRSRAAPASASAGMGTVAHGMRGSVSPRQVSCRKRLPAGTLLPPGLPRLQELQGNIWVMGSSHSIPSFWLGSCPLSCESLGRAGTGHRAAQGLLHHPIPPQALQMKRWPGWPQQGAEKRHHTSKRGNRG